MSTEPRVQSAAEQRVCAIAAAAGHELNNELTIILNGITEALASLEAGDPERLSLLEMQGAVQRCAWLASGLLNYSSRRGVRTSGARFQSLLEM